MHPFTLAFLAALAIATGVGLWLAVRHVRFVQAHRVSVPADFAADITIESHQRAADYSTERTRLRMVHVVYDAAVLLVLTLGGLMQAVYAAWGGWLAEGIWRDLAFVGSVALILALADLPFAWYRTFVVEQRFGFNRMTPALFVSDLLKQAAVSTAFGAPLLLLVLWLMERMGTLWWLYVWAAWAVFNLLVMAIYPTFIAPLFNKFSPLENSDLKSRIEALLVKCGFRSQGLFVMDGSRRSSHGNAYFTGFGNAKRIVLFDTLINRLDPPEVEAVLAHELGHFRCRHVPKRLAWTFGVSLLFLWVLGYAKEQAWFYEALGMTSQSTGIALVLFFLVAPAFTFLLHPLMTMLSRRHEFEADRYAADHADSEDLIRALVKLYRENAATLTPDPLHSAFYDSHPPAAQRIARLRAAPAH